ncbi:NAD(P)H-dependent oxidoreductase [Gillisia hiemivivida]|uniref:NAD(P)H-dependent oxidoreductase n=1 Tax=Gillisia hiemivivida TaxID=291190 RepID=A0A5C6ZU40_9FLAO|nr:NAD(P)H-dependent oxidoreductase [Gillisia hiemivivida]TXD94271.1 NAD(P)H-dependent oxidoreductase [Gillisia hiemivivida]
MNNIEALKWRYATKKFDENRILSEDKIEILKHAFNLTATSYGLQPIKMVIVRNKALQSKLVKYSMNQQQVGSASHVLVLCIEREIDKNFIENYFNYVQKIRATPNEILSPFKDFLIDDFKNKHIDEITSWATNQAFLALGTLLTVSATEAIDACPMEGFEPEKYDEVLGLDKLNLKSVLVLPVGFRAKDDMFSEFKKVRRPISDVIIELE